MQFQLKYYKDPGLIMDAIKILTLKLNPKRYLPSTIMPKNRTENELARLSSLVNTFPAPPKELYIFVYKQKENTVNFLTQYLEKRLCHNFPKIDTTSFSKDLQDIPRIKQMLFQFYFRKNYTSTEHFVSLLRGTTLMPDSLRFYLLSFDLDPAAFISLLVMWLQKYITIIEKDYYPVHKNFTPDSASIYSAINYSYPNQANSFVNRPLFYSVCPVVQDYLYIYSSSKQNWLMTGCHFKDVVSTLPNIQGSIDLEKIFDALGNQKRLDIINHLLSNSSASKQELIQILSLPISSFHHHLEKLRDAQLIIQHKHSRSNIYSLNHSVFKELCQIFKSYSQGVTHYETLETPPNSFN